MTQRLKFAPLFLAAVCLVLAAPPERPRTFANPINIEYRFMTDSPSRREAADPVILLFGDDYYLFASESGGYWRSPEIALHDLNAEPAYYFAIDAFNDAGR